MLSYVVSVCACFLCSLRWSKGWERRRLPGLAFIFLLGGDFCLGCWGPFCFDLLVYLPPFRKAKKKRYKGENSSDQGQIDGHPLSSYRSCSFAARFCFSSPPPPGFMSPLVRPRRSELGSLLLETSGCIRHRGCLVLFPCLFVPCCSIQRSPGRVFSALIPADSVFRFPLSAYEDGHLRVPIG